MTEVCKVFSRVSSRVRRMLPKKIQLSRSYRMEL